MNSQGQQNVLGVIADVSDDLKQSKLSMER